MISMNLAELRKYHKYSQEKVAEAIGVSRQAVAKWENGESMPDIENCVALAKFYDVTVDDLITHNSKNAGYPISPKGKYMFGTVTVGDRGQVVIPKKAREIFNIKPGDQVLFLGDEAQAGIAIVRADEFMKMINDVLKDGGGVKNDGN